MAKYRWAVTVNIALVSCGFLLGSPFHLSDGLEMSIGSHGHIKSYWSGSSLHTDHCNEQHLHTGLEGEMFPAYKLKQVHIVISPGPRDLSFKMEDQGLDIRQQLNDLEKDSVYLNKLNKFKEVIGVYKSLNVDNYKEFLPSFSPSYDFDNLTLFGFQQQISLGEYLYKSYLVNRQPDHTSSQPYVECVHELQSFRSLLPVLFGLLNEKQFIRTKIRKILSSFCDINEMLVPTCHCSEVEDLQPYISQAVSQGSHMFKELVIKSKIKQNKEGSNLEHLSEVELYKMAVMYICNNVSDNICANADHYFCHPDVIQHLGSTVSSFLLDFYSDPIVKKFSEMRTYPFLQRILSKASQWKSYSFLHMYMGDETFVQHLRSSLRIMRAEISPVSSRLVFEVFEKIKGQPNGGKLFMRILYNGKDMTKHVSGSEVNMENGLCRYEAVQLLVTHLRSQYVDKCL